MIEADREGDMIPAEVLSGNTVIETRFFDGEKLVNSSNIDGPWSNERNFFSSTDSLAPYDLSMGANLQAKMVHPSTRSLLVASILSRTTFANGPAFPSSTTTPHTLPRNASTETFSGQGTYYNTYNGYGACGNIIHDTDMIVAVSHLLYDETVPLGSTNPNLAAVCGQQITASGPNGSITVTVADRCTGCQFFDLDFTPFGFQQIGQIPVGRIPITWSWVSGGPVLTSIPGGVGTPTPTPTSLPPMSTSDSTSSTLTRAPTPASPAPVSATATATATTATTATTTRKKTATTKRRHTTASTTGHANSANHSGHKDH
ncbi:hypothetical protein HDU98_011990 [Podochytrium sp. JEL0797]|nr:hypothetical protein HDU98_011990 [Podochytrium sp. JEL0797]